MMIKQIFQTTLIAAFLATGLSGCQADADGSTNGGLNGNGTGQIDGDDGVNAAGEVEGTDGDTTTNGPGDTGLPNDPNGPGGSDVDNSIGFDPDGEAGPAEQGDIAGGTGPGANIRFQCTEAFDTAAGATTEVGLNGLVGDALTPVLETLGAGSVTALANSITDKDLAADADLKTASVYTLLASLGGDAVGSIDENIYPPAGTEIAAGKYAVAAVSFPPALLNVGLLTNVNVSTYKGETLVDTRDYDATQIDLLGQVSTAAGHAYIGFKASGAYDRVVVGLSAGALAVDAGESMYLHEVCTDGKLVAVTAP